MPNIITHTIFCEEVLKTITNKTYKEKIENNLNEYKIGANGPDFFFFYGFYPFWKKQDTKIPAIGTKFHNVHINDFYESAITSYLSEEDSPKKDAMAAYIIGHYLHWQLDSIMHPYVVYRTGFKEKLSKYYHHRFESMMDTIMLDRYRDESIKTFQTFKICWQSHLSVDAISQVYIPATKKFLNIEIDKNIIKKALDDWESAQRLLYDPHGIKYHLIKIYEFIIRKPWLFSGNIVRTKIDQHHDIMNDFHKLWLHPCKGTQSKESVSELFDKAEADAQIGLNLLFNALDGNGYVEFLKFIDNKTYANGINSDEPRKHKEVIYK